jgi:hypothetical protein
LVLKLAAAVTAAGWMVAAGCVVGGFDLASGAGGDDGSGGGTGGASSGQGGAGGEICAHATWPPPPSITDPGANTVDFVVAGRTLDFGEQDLSNGPQVGYDLDNRCTCQGEGPSCKEPEFATEDHCDGPAGRDNAVAQLFNRLGQFDADFTSANYTERANDGEGTLLVRVRDYNGQANDQQVTVAIFPSPGMDKDPCNTGSTTPQWDGNDLWAVDRSALVGWGGGGSGVGGSGVGGAGGAGGRSWWPIFPRRGWCSQAVIRRFRWCSPQGSSPDASSR